MRKLNVLFLGWDLLPSVYEKQQTGCYPIVQALAKRVNLSLILPQTDPTFILPNVETTGLNQVDLEVIQPSAPQPSSLPYAEVAYKRNKIPLYGSAEAVKHSQDQAVQQLSTGTFATAASIQDKQSKREQKGVGQPNIFAYKDFEELSLDAQVIQYARYACRWANQLNFDLIYAYNYMTFLAGTELKLVSGKKLILHVDALSYERRNPNSKGWMHALEKQALQKCDYIFTTTDYLATILEQEYGLSTAVIKSLEEVKVVTMASKVNPLVNAVAANSTWRNFAGPTQQQVNQMAHEREKEGWQQNAETIWEVMQKVATS